MFKKNEIVSCVVVDTISRKDPDYLDSMLRRFADNTGSKSIFNMKYLLKCPINSIIAKINNPDCYVILYPFFSSHISLPVKPGEHVWTFFPDGYGSNDIGYWITRRSTDYYIEDTNFTHNVRSAYRKYNNVKVIDSDTEIEDYFRIDGIGLPSYLNVLNNSIGNQTHVFENVERVPKNPSDLLIQGSNNSHALFTAGNKKDTGTIILSAGRGNSEKTASILKENSAKKEENNKAVSLTKEGTRNKNEGMFDAVNDKSFIVISENPAYLNSLSIEKPEDVEFPDTSTIFAKCDDMRLKAINSINSYASTISNESSTYTILSENVSISSNTCNVSTDGWSVDMQEFFNILEETLQELSYIASAAAPFATGVGPTGPSTNAAKIQALLNRIKNMKG